MRSSAALSLPAGTGGASLRPGRALAISAPVMPPQTRHSAVELEPSRLPPCSETQAASPAAQMPATRVRPLMSVSTPPIE